jgi:hydrogenase maturation protease
MELETSNLKLRTSRSIVVLGLGNPLMADEGVGVAVIEQLQSQAERYPDVELIDAGTGGMAVLHWIEGRQKAIFVDCAFMDEPPGTIRRFTPDQVRSTKKLAHQSLHEADLLKILDLAEQLGQAPQQVVIFGIQPETVTPRLGLSKIIKDRMEHYIEVIRSELETGEKFEV